MDGGTAAHEFGHAIGLAHEHQNPAGGIEWNESAVIKSLSGPPNNWNEATIRHNVLNKYLVNQIQGTAFRVFITRRFGTTIALAAKATIRFASGGISLAAPFN